MNNVWDKVKDVIKQRKIPLDIVIELTRRCNLKCCHCYNLKDEQSLSFCQIKKIAAQLRDAGVLFITLTGGEIFTHPEILEICSYLKEKGFDLKIFTNGTFIDESNIKSIESLYFSEVGISIQGANSQTHDQITGSPGSFDKSIKAIKLLKKHNIPVNIKTTLMKNNFDEFKALIGLSEKLGASYIMDPVVSPKDDGSKDILANRISCEQLEDFYKYELRRHKGHELEQADDLLCPAGTVMASISAKGDVYPCVQLPEKLGNVFREPFKKIWQESAFLEKLRSIKNIEQCIDCNLSEHCNRCPGLAYLEDGDAFGKSSAACSSAGTYKKIMDE